MKKRYIDPFTSDIPQLDPARFAGRKEQIELVIDALYQTANGKPTNIIITGERGIGKSSLLNQAKELAQGDLTLPRRLGMSTEDIGFDYLVIWRDAATDQGPKEIAMGVIDDLQAFEVSITLDAQSTDADRASLQGNVSGDIDLAALINHFCSVIARTSRLCLSQGKSGIIILLDELDRAAPRSGVATFFKLVIEKLARDKVRNVAFFCAGMSGAIQHLEEDHASIFRSFRDIHLRRLQPEETRDILESGFTSVGFDFDPAVFSSIHNLAAGNPEPIHLLGSQSLAADKDNVITEEDVQDAKLRVLRDLRKRKFSALLHNAGAGNNQTILKAMADYKHDNVPLDFISETLAQPYKKFHSTIVSLHAKGLIVPGQKGTYSFVDPLLRAYIQTFGVLKLETESSSAG